MFYSPQKLCIRTGRVSCCQGVKQGVVSRSEQIERLTRRTAGFNALLAMQAFMLVTSLVIFG